MAEGQATFVDRACFDQLLREHDLLRKDFERLVDCIGHGETLCQTSWQYHKGKFETARLRSPLGTNRPSLPDTLVDGPLQLMQRLWGGRKEMLALREVSTSSRACAESAFIGYDIHVCGGLDGVGGNPVRSAACFHLQDQVWESLPPSPVTPIGGAGAMLDGYFYTCGSGGHFGKAAWRLKLARQKWEQLALMNERRSNPAAALVGGQLYICGGEDHVENLVHNSLEYFDALAPNPRNPQRAGVWRLLPAPMSARRRHLGAAAIGGAGRQELLLCGGTSTPTNREAKGCEPLAFAEVLELLEPGPRLRSLPPMLGPRMGHAVACLRGRVYACGGEAVGGVVLSTVDCYDAATEAWSTSPPMLLPRVVAAAAVAAGRLLVLGGLRSGWPPGVPAERDVQRFDPATGAWEVLDWELVHGRTDFCAAAVWRGALAA